MILITVAKVAHDPNGQQVSSIELYRQGFEEEGFDMREMVMVLNKPAEKQAKQEKKG